MRFHCISCGDLLGQHEPYSTTLVATGYDPTEYCVDCLVELEQGTVPSRVAHYSPIGGARRRGKGPRRVWRIG